MSFKTTNLPDYADTVLFQKKEFYENNTNLLDIFGDYIEELNFNIDYEKGNYDYSGIDHDSVFINEKE